jgi:hypothetical protein
MQDISEKFHVTCKRLRLPRSGDVVRGVTVKGDHLTDVRVCLFGDLFKRYRVTTGKETFVPITVNLLRLGTHDAIVEFDSDDVEVTVHTILYDDIEYRRTLCKKEPGDVMPVEWYTEISLH